MEERDRPDARGAEPHASRPSLKAHAYAHLRRRILTLDLAPGEHLDEVRLSAEYGMSRTPMRDVLRHLAGEGCIELRDHRSAVVAPMDIRTLRSFFQSAPLIYASVARLAAENRTNAQVEALRRIQGDFREALAREDVEAIVTFNDAFHHAIGEMARNPYLMASLRRLLVDHARIGQTFWRARDRDMASKIAAAAEQHDRMIGHIASGEAAAAVEVTLAHWELSRDHIEDYVRVAPLPLDPVPTHRDAAGRNEEGPADSAEPRQGRMRSA